MDQGFADGPASKRCGHSAAIDPARGQMNLREGAGFLRDRIHEPGTHGLGPQALPT